MTIQLTLMTTDEARATVERIKGKLEDIRGLLWELREREGWRALGYETWQTCIRDEFAMSRMHAHRLVNAFVVDRMLAAGNDVTNGYVRTDVAKIPESHARELEVLTADPEAVREIHAEVMEATKGMPTATDYRAAVAQRLGAEVIAVGVDEALLDATPEPEIAAAAMAEAAELLQEPDEERAYSMVGRQRFWMKLVPERVADTSPAPDQDAPEWEAFAAWCGRVAGSLRARARQRVRLVE